MAQKAPAVLIATPDSQWKIKITMPEGQGNFQGFIRFVNRETGIAIANSTIGTGGDFPWTYSGPDNRTMEAVLPFANTKDLGVGEWSADLVRGSVSSPGTRRAAIVVKQVWQGDVGGMGEMAVTGDGECDIQINEQVAAYPFDLQAAIAQAVAAALAAQGSASLAQTLLDSVSAIALVIAGNLAATQAAAATATAVSGLANLSAAARAIALDTNVLAVYVYDTRRDKDLGAWVYKTNVSINQEALNTATRGSKAQYPTLMVIVLTTTGLTIYDADDLACPMWAVFLAGGNGANANIINSGTTTWTSVSAQQGVITFGTSTVGLWTIDLIGDSSDRFFSSATGNTGSYLGNLAQRNAGLGRDGLNGSYLGQSRTTIFSGGINNLAMMVPKHTPANDNRFGLPNPLIAAATVGGIVIIRPEGASISSNSATAAGRVSFDKDGNLYATPATTSSVVWMYNYPLYLISGFVAGGLSNASSPASMTGQPTGATMLRSAGNRIAWGAAGWGLSTMRRHRGILGNSIMSYADDQRATAYVLPGTPKLALAESNKLLSNLQTVELLTNGSFATDLTGWTNDDLGTGFAPSAWDAGNGGRVKLERLNGTNRAGRYVDVATVINQTYQLVVTTSGGVIQASAGVVGYAAGANTTTRFLYRAVATTTRISIRGRDDGTVPYVDDISFKAVAADYSQLTGNHAEIIGTITRAPVAAGAELACWQDPRTSNGYGSIPNLSNTLNIGTGDFAIAAWYKRTNSSAAEALMHFTDEVGGPSDDTGSNANWRLYVISSGIPFFGGRTAAGTTFGYSSSTAVPLNTWQHLVVLRRGTRVEMYINGVLVATGTQSGDLSNNNGKLLIAAQFINGVTNSNRLLGNMALPRFSTGAAPSPAQVAAMYADELAMFQPNAKCLLQGGTGIQDIAYDPDTELTYVAKSAGGTDVFQGLVNKGAILSTSSINKFRNSGFFGAVLGGAGVGTIASGPVPGVSNGISMSIVGAGSGYVDMRINGTATTTGNIAWSPQGNLATPASPSETWTFSQEEQIVAGSMAGFTSHELRLDRLDAGGATVGSIGATAITPTTNNSRYSTTVTTEALTATIALRWIFRFNVGAVVDVTIRLRRPQTEKAAAFTTFVDGLTNSDNHKFVAAHDGQVIVGTTAGVDAFAPAFALRERLRMGRQPILYDPNESTFDGRGTSDATPTYVGNTFYVPEGGMVDFTMTISARIPNTATERAKYVVNGYAYRDIGATDATVVILANPPTPAEVTASMDATVVSIGNGYVGPRGTGKAGTNLEWFGRQSLVRNAA